MKKLIPKCQTPAQPLYRRLGFASEEAFNKTKDQSTAYESEDVSNQRQRTYREGVEQQSERNRQLRGLENVQRFTPVAFDIAQMFNTPIGIASSSAAPLFENNMNGVITDMLPGLIKYLGKEHLENGMQIMKKTKRPRSSYKQQRSHFRNRRGAPIGTAFGGLMYTIGQGLNVFDLVSDGVNVITTPYKYNDNLNKNAY